MDIWYEMVGGGSDKKFGCITSDSTLLFNQVDANHS